MSHVNYLSIFIPVFLVLFILQLLTPCLVMAFTEPENNGLCINDTPIMNYLSQFKISSNSWIGTILTIFNVFIQAITCLLWNFQVAAWINLILMPLRLIGYFCLYKIFVPDAIILPVPI